MPRRKRTPNRNDLDLHGVKHADVFVKVEEHVLLHEAPFSIITGNSNAMKKIVKEVLDKHGFKYMDSMFTLGSIMVMS
jgi:hypothetical protein